MPAPMLSPPPAARHVARHVTITQASTEDVPAGERLRHWEAYTAAALIGVRCSSFAAEGLRARQRNFDLGGLRLAEIAGNEHVVERTRPIMRRHPKQALFGCLLLEGESFFYQAGRCIPIREGDLIVYGTTTPYLYGVTRPMRLLQIDLPVEQLMDTCPIADGLAPIKIDGSLRAGRLLTEPLRREMLDFVDAPQADRAPAVAQRLRSLVEVLVRAHAGDRAHGNDLRLLRAERFIAEHLSNPELGAEAVARHLSMSPRHLSRVFGEHDCSVTQWIWRERLALAHRLLADPSDAAHAATTIGEIAWRCGFATQAHFARMFKERYGQTPREHRLRELGGGPDRGPRADRLRRSAPRESPPAS